MGSNNKPRRSENVTKDRGTPGGGAGGGGSQSSSKNSCLFNFRFTFQVNQGVLVVAGQESFITPSTNGSDLDLFIEGIRVGTYKGKNENKILKCISEGFVYEGRVLAVGPNSTVEIEIKGNG